MTEGPIGLVMVWFSPWSFSGSKDWTLKPQKALVSRALAVRWTYQCVLFQDSPWAESSLGHIHHGCILPQCALHHCKHECQPVKAGCIPLLCKPSPWLSCGSGKSSCIDSPAVVHSTTQMSNSHTIYNNYPHFLPMKYPETLVASMAQFWLAV